MPIKRLSLDFPESFIVEVEHELQFSSSLTRAEFIRQLLYSGLTAQRKHRMAVQADPSGKVSQAALNAWANDEDDIIL